MAQNVTIAGASYSNVPAVKIPKSSGGTATFTDTSDSTVTASHLETGYTAYDSTGTKITGTLNPSGGGSMNVQVCFDHSYIKATSYTATSCKLTVAVTGTYTVSWVGMRSSTSGTNGTQLYVAGKAYGSAQTSFDSTCNQVQYVKLTGVSLTQGQEIVVRARSRSTSYSAGAANLMIEQTA